MTPNLELINITDHYEEMLGWQERHWPFTTEGPPGQISFLPPQKSSFKFINKVSFEILNLKMNVGTCKQMFEPDGQKL